MFEIVTTARVNLLALFVILFLLIGGKCSFAPPIEQQTNQTNSIAKANDSQLKRREVVFHQPRVIWGYFEQIHYPIKVTDIKIVETGTAKGDLRIEMMNVSSKPIVAAKLAFSPPECGKFVLYGGLTDIDWGDVSLIGKPTDAVRKKGSPVLKSGEVGVVIFKRKLLEAFLRRDYYEGCKPENSFATLGQTIFRFEDGTEWRLKDEVEKYER
jgi:hypothetical protein